MLLEEIQKKAYEYREKVKNGTEKEKKLAELNLTVVSDTDIIKGINPSYMIGILKMLGYSNEVVYITYKNLLDEINQVYTYVDIDKGK